ncbi:unnamed protein product [Closterium sp. NIES-54]
MIELETRWLAVLEGTGAGGTGTTGGTGGAAAVGAAAGSPSSHSGGAGPGGASAGVLGVGRAGGTDGADTRGANGGTGVGGARRQESDALDIPTPRTYAEAIMGPYCSQWQIAMDTEMASWKSTGTYVDEVPQPGANIVDGMWIFRVKRPPSSPPAFKACYVAQGFSQREGVKFFENFSPTPKMTTLLWTKDGVYED